MLVGNSSHLLTSLGVILTLLCVSITSWELGPMHLCWVENPGHRALPCIEMPSATASWTGSQTPAQPPCGCRKEGSISQFLGGWFSEVPLFSYPSIPSFFLYTHCRPAPGVQARVASFPVTLQVNKWKLLEISNEIHQSFTLLVLEMSWGPLVQLLRSLGERQCLKKNRHS